MNQLYALVGMLLAVSLFSCSSDNSATTDTVPLLEKKLLKVTQEGTYGISEKELIYDVNHNLTALESRFTAFGEATSELYATVFTYANQKVVSAVAYRNGILYQTYAYTYSNSDLTESLCYDSNGIEEERRTFTYYSNHKMKSYAYYVASELQQTENFTYTADGNVNTAKTADYSEIQHDAHPTPSSRFSAAHQIIFETESLFTLLSNNNESSRTTTYNYGLFDAVLYHYTTAITYDADGFPVRKTLTETDSNHTNARVVTTTTFEYEQATMDRAKVL